MLYSPLARRFQSTHLGNPSFPRLLPTGTERKNPKETQMEDTSKGALSDAGSVDLSLQSELRGKDLHGTRVNREIPRVGPHLCILE